MRTDDGGLAPLEKSVHVSLSPIAAFELFTVHMNEWWPLATHSVGGGEARECGMQLMEGGRIYEIQTGGKEVDWGRISGWEPPLRMSFSWHPGRNPKSAQLVSLEFSAAAGGATVSLQHDRWSVLGEEAQTIRTRYDSGWDYVLGSCFAGFANAGAHADAAGAAYSV